MWEAKERPWGPGDQRNFLIFRDCLSPPPPPLTLAHTTSPLTTHHPDLPWTLSLGLCSCWSNIGNDLAHIPLREILLICLA